MKPTRPDIGSIRRGIGFVVFLFVFPLVAMATERAFPPTPVDTAEVKTLPTGVLLKSTAEGSYFENSNALFMPLFRYISRNDIAMTVPVEAAIDEAAMYFWVAPDQVDRVKGSDDVVEVIEIPPRLVASWGGRGGYSEENFKTARAALKEWLASRPDLKITGEPYAVYWNGPFTPWFVKRFEVHVPVERAEATP